MEDSAPFLTGVIEGFYGRSWSMGTRRAYIDYLAEAGLNTFIYCPKGDAFLRRRWQEDWPEENWRDLLELSAAYRRNRLHWGVGLSPLALYQDYGTHQRLQLRRKVERLGELSASLIAILFDDMPGGVSDLAERQGEIVSDVCRWTPGLRVLACPTYYSYDPVLEAYFGKMPMDYWPQLGRSLPQEVDVFWTGPKVCSDSIGVRDVRSIVEQLGRPVTLWDNYPVNDGAARSEFLYTSKLAAREAGMRPLLRGHLCNPMNQGLLSLPALSGLAELYGSRGLDDSALSRIMGSLTWEKLSRDRRMFEIEGLTGLGAQIRQQLASEYGKLPGPAAQEITEWLRGDYEFDPACLTG